MGPPLDPVVLLVLRGGAALLFLGAALHKLRDLGSFAQSLAGYGLLPRGSVRLLAGAFAALELAVGLGCLLPGGALLALHGGVALLATYTGAVAANLARGRRHVDCGCGGPGGPQTLHAGLVVRNGVLMALLILAAQPASARALVWLDACTVVAGTAWLALAYAAVDVALAHTARATREGGLSWSRR